MRYAICSRFFFHPPLQFFTPTLASGRRDGSLPPNLKRQSIVVLKAINGNHCPLDYFPDAARVRRSCWVRVAASSGSCVRSLLASSVPPLPAPRRGGPVRQSSSARSLAARQAGSPTENKLCRLANNWRYQPERPSPCRRDNGEDPDAQCRQANNPDPGQAVRDHPEASAAAALPEAQGKRTTAEGKEKCLSQNHFVLQTIAAHRRLFSAAAFTARGVRAASG